MIRTLAFWTAVIGYVLLAILIVAGGAAWPGYSHIGQFISELGANGAPHGRLVSLAGFLPVGVLLMAFSVLAASLQPRNALKIIGFIGLFLFALGYFAAAFFPCDFGCRPEDPSPSQMMHNLFGLLGYVFAPLMLLLLAFGVRKEPGGRWLLPLGIACAVVAGAGFLTIETDLRGLAQRALEAAVALWVLAYAFSLRASRPSAP